MIRVYSILIVGLLSMMSMNAMANINITFGSAPPDREVVMPPRGYVTCHNVPSGYRNGIWVNQHRVCKYSRHRGMWVSGHWQCIQGIPRKGICLRWDWVPSYWEGGSRVEVYTPPMPPSSHVYPGRAYASSAVPRPPVPMPVPDARQPGPVPVPGAGPQPGPVPVGGQPSAERV